MLHIERRYIDVETGDAHLVLRQRCLHRLAIIGGAQVAGDQHDEQRAVNRVLLPAIGCGLEMLAQILALLAGAYEIEHAAADGVLGGIAGVAHLCERADIAATGAGNDLAPVAVIGLAKLREQPHQRAVAGILHLVGQLDAIGLLPSAEKDLGAADDVTEQFLYAVLGDFQMGLDGLAGFDGLRRAGWAMGVENFLSGNLCRNGLPQIFVDLTGWPGQVAKEHGAIDAGRTGIVQHRLFVVTPPIPHP